MSSPRSVADYLAACSPAARKALTQVRAAIRKALPLADEVVSYGIIGYRLEGRMVIYCGGWKAHYSLYPAGPSLVAAFSQELAGKEFSTGTLRFPLDEKVPTALITRVAKFRAAEVAGAAAMKTKRGALQKRDAPSGRSKNTRAPRQAAPSR